MKQACIALVLACQASLAGAIAPGWICFGNEPSWSLRFHDASRATLAFPDAGPVEHVGATRALPPRREWMWRAHPAAGAGDAVAFVTETACSDGMSDMTHRASVRLSLPDGRFLAGCCRIAAASPSGAGLEGRRWKLVRAQGVDVDVASARPPVTARFAEGRVHGFGGCNRWTGAYTLDGEHVTIGSLASTSMACPQPVMTIEQAVTRALAGTFRVDVRERSLTLASSAGPSLTFEELPPPSLAGPKWTVTGYHNGRSAIVSPLNATALSLQFQEGRLQGHAGCNTFRGTYAVDGDRIAVGPLATTRKACKREGVMAQEQDFLTALRSATTWTIDDRGMLDMHRADGARALTAAPPAP